MGKDFHSLKHYCSYYLWFFYFFFVISGWFWSGFTRCKKVQRKCELANVQNNHLENHSISFIEILKKHLLNILCGICQKATSYFGVISCLYTEI